MPISFSITVNRKRKTSRPSLRILLLIVFLDNLGFAIVFPYLYFYAFSLGADAFTYGLLLSAYSLMSFISTPLIARLSDRLGRKRILLPALFLSGSSYVVFGVANVLWLLFLARVIAGTTAATVPVAQAYVADVTDEKQRLKYFGLTSAAGGLAFIVGQAIGGFLGGFIGFALPSFVAAAVAFANLVTAYFFLHESKHPLNNTSSEKLGVNLSTLRGVLSERQVVSVFTAYFLFFVSFVFLQTILPPWSQKLFSFGAFETSLFFVGLGGVSVATQAVILPRLSGKASNLTIAFYGVILMTSGFLVLGTLTNIAFLFLVGVFIAIGFGMLLTTLSTMVSVKAPRTVQGGSLGVAWALAALAQAVGPTLAALTFVYGVSSGFDGFAFILAAVVTTCIIPILLYIRKHQLEQTQFSLAAEKV